MFNPVFIRREPVNGARKFAGIQNELDQVLSSFLDGCVCAPEEKTSAKTPAVNVSETDEKYVVEAELPGIAKEELDISVIGDTVTIEGERKETTQENASARRREFSYGKFARKLQFRHNLDPDAVEATFKDGVLTLSLPKAKDARPRKIKLN